MQLQNLQIAPNGVKPLIHVSQFDVGRQFQLKLYDGTTAYTPPGGTTMYIEGIKPDNKGFSYGASDGAISYSGNTVTITTLEQMTIVKGYVKCEIRMVQGSNNIGTLNFDMLVEESPVNESVDISETVLPVIFALATEQMENAEAWAKGTKDGVPVTSSDPQYHDNAKYWNDQTHLMDNEAEAWAKGTKDGTPVTSSDPQYHDNAKYWNEQTNLDGEAWTKGTRDGVDVPTTAPQYHNNAKYWSEQSHSYANNSSSSATLSQSWARGGTNTRSGEDTNNSMYYANRADQVGATWAREAEAWAIGERNGVPVVSGDDTYENNSKYYCGESKSVYQQCLTALTSISAYYALIRQIMGTIYLQTEAGDNLITESGDSIVIDY